MNAMFGKTMVGLAVLAVTGLAQANATYEGIVDVAGSVSVDGWNELNRNRTGGALTEAELIAGIGSNVAGSGDAVFTRLSGSHYPAGYGLYGSNSVFTFTDSTVASNIGSLVFQGIINDFDAQFGAAPFTLTLSLNGGSEALSATSVSSVLNGGVSDLHTYTWDLSGVSTPITSYTLTLSAGFSQVLALQVDQVAAVPEPSTYAMAIAGLALVGVMARRRRVAH
jgi:hypothetical protein